MPIMSILSLKGGVGKTTLSINTAYELSKQNYKIALVDADQQESLNDFMQHRKEEKFCDYYKYTTKKELLNISKNYDLVIVDNSPRINEIINDIVEVSDLCLMITKLSILDYYTNVELVKFMKKYNKEAYFVLTNVHHFQQKEKAEIKAGLEKLGYPVLKQTISHSNDYIKSINSLKTLSEIKSKKVAEIQLLLQEIVK